MPADHETKDPNLGGDAEAPPHLNDRQKDILYFITQYAGEHGYPPSVREIGEAVGLRSPSTVHNHLARLQAMGFLKRDTSKPRALDVNHHLAGAQFERRPVTHVPLVGDVAAGTGVLAEENIEEVLPLPQDLTGEGDLFMLRVRGDSMIDAGILSGDLIVARAQSFARNGDIVVAGIHDEEATVKTYYQDGNVVELRPSNAELDVMRFDANSVRIFGKVVTVMRRL